LESWVIGVDAGVNIRNNSCTGHVEYILSLVDVNDLSRGLVHISVTDAVAVVTDRGRVPQTLRRRGRTRLIGVVWRDHQGLIGFGIKYSVDKPKETRKELRQKTLNGPDQENLVHVAIDIADHCTAIGKASKLQPGKTEVRPDDNPRLRTKDAGQDLPDV
jgi:hypothetical protein